MLILDLDLIDKVPRTICAFFCKALYRFISWLYELFITIASVNFLSSEEIQPIYQRITMILTIVMVFYVTFEFVKYVMQPDDITNGEKGVGNMAFKLIAVILLIAFVPRIFGIAYELQGRIIKGQIIPKVILGNETVEPVSAGKEFSADMFEMFYKVNEDACPNNCESRQIVEYNLNTLRTEGHLKELNVGLNESENVRSEASGKNEKVAVIDFDGFPAIVVGIIVVYILALYCVDVGTRYAQLLFLQVMSPIAIMGYLTPKKDNMFSKWTKQCISTYIDLFLRIAIIYFVLLICRLLGNLYKSKDLFAGLDVSDGIQNCTYIALILGLLVFANKAPNLLKDLIPSVGGSGIGFGLKRSERVAPLAAKALGTSAAALSGGAVKLGARLRNEQARRKKIKDNLLNEGKSADRKSVNKAIRQSKAAEKQAKKNLRNREKALGTARDEYVKAQEAYETAKNSGNADSNKLAELEQNVKNKKAQFDAIKSTGAVSAETQRRVTSAREKVRMANEKIATARANGSYDKMSDQEKVRLDTELRNAQAEYNSAQLKFTEEKNNTYDNAKRNYLTASAEYAKAKNSAYGSYIGLQGITAALSGVASGALTGLSAKNASEIIQKAKESAKNVREGEAARIKYLESGGSATISSSVNKAIIKLQQTFGMQTASEIIKEEINAMESMVKENDALANIEKGLKSAQDSAEDRASKKIMSKEQKIRIINQDDLDKLNKEIGSNNLGISIGVGETTSEIYSKYEAKANASRATADALHQQLATAEMEGRATDQMRAYVNQKEEEALKAAAVKEEVLKKLRNYAITRTMRKDFTSGEKEDAVLSSNISTMNQTVENARNNPQTVSYLQDLVLEGKLSQQNFDAFINNEINAHEIFDAIQGKLTNHVSTLSDRNSAIQQTINATKENAATAAINATTDAAGGSKK